MCHQTSLSFKHSLMPSFINTDPSALESDTQANDANYKKYLFVYLSSLKAKFMSNYK